MFAVCLVALLATNMLCEEQHPRTDDTRAAEMTSRPFRLLFRADQGSWAPASASQTQPRRLKPGYCTFVFQSSDVSTEKQLIGPPWVSYPCSGQFSYKKKKKKIHFYWKNKTKTYNVTQSQNVPFRVLSGYWLTSGSSAGLFVSLII